MLPKLPGNDERRAWVIVFVCSGCGSGFCCVALLCFRTVFPRYFASPLLALLACPSCFIPPVLSSWFFSVRDTVRAVEAVHTVPTAAMTFG